jgi:iron complex outermembrane recepter protein
MIERSWLGGRALKKCLLGEIMQFSAARYRALVLASVSVFATSAALAAPAAAPKVDQPPAPQAQPAPEATGGTVDSEKVTVTARRSRENVQDVPGAVSAFSEKSLDRLGATDSTGIQGAVPNLNIVQGRGSSNATNIYIRGVGQPDALQTFDPAVGVYVDDVYLSRIRGTQFELLDIERLEVLRGPQGTLYGKNTIGGALKVITRRPDQDFRAIASLTAGSYNELTGNVVLSGGLSDGLAGSAAFMMTSRDGYVTNPVTGAEYNDRDAKAGRVKLAWDAADNFTVDISADYATEDNAMVLGQATSNVTTILGVPLVAIVPPGPEFNFTARPTPGLPNSTKMTHWGGSVNMNWDINQSVSIKSITAYRKLQNEDFIDIDATPVEVGDVFVGVDQNQISQELLVTYEEGAFKIIGGLYALKEGVTSHQEAYADDFVIGFLGATSFLRTVDDDLDTTSLAAFANATVKLGEGLNLSAGVRATAEEKDYFRTTSTFSNQPLLNGTFAFRGSETWSDVSPMVSLDYQAAENAMVYARYASGFKSGGFNGRANNPGEDQPYDPETLQSFEIGAKTDWAGGKLRANVAAFYNDYTDFQARVSRVVTSPSQPVPAIDFAVINAGGLEIYGAELELLAFPMPELRLDAQIGYLHAEYSEFFETRNPGPIVVDRSFQTPAFSPELTARFGGQYTVSMDKNGTLVFGGAARFRTEMALAVDNSDIFTKARFPGMWQEAYWLFDAQIVWTDPTEKLSVGLYGKNLSDEIYRTDAQEFSSVGGIRTAYYGAPMTGQLKLTVRY